MARRRDRAHSRSQFRNHIDGEARDHGSPCYGLINIMLRPLTDKGFHTMKTLIPLSPSTTHAGANSTNYRMADLPATSRPLY